MKKIIYSPVTKLLALLLSLVCVFQTVTFVTDCIIEFFGVDREIYQFENNFYESRLLSMELHYPLFQVNSAYVFLNEENSRLTVQEDKKTLTEFLEEEPEFFGDKEKYHYIIEIEDAVIKSDENISKEEILSGSFAVSFEYDGTGVAEYFSTSTVGYYWHDLENIANSKITVFAALDEKYVEECKSIWTEQRNLVYNTFSRSISLVLIFLVLLIYLICSCGKNSLGEHKHMWLDKIPVELHLAFMVLFFGLGLGVAVILFDELFSYNFPQYIIETTVPILSTVAVFLIIVSLLSLVRKVKCGMFLSTSIIFIVLKWTFKLSKRIFACLYSIAKRMLKACFASLKCIARAFSTKTSFILLVFLAVYTAVIPLLFYCTFFEDSFWLVLLILVFLFAVFFVSYRARDFEEISKGASQIRRGNLSYEIPEPKSEDMKVLARNINEIAKGLDESVSAKLRAERLKTELITNVSHDIKTPITSIVNYTELLSKIEGMPEEAKDYISIISRKTDRLKTLTQDLFDISKVQSGNENINFERLDISLLINQSVGEHDGEIAGSGLKFCVDTEPDLYVNADGRKMSRVVGNLIGNILKYTMKGTRVFITSKMVDGKVIAEFKNVASYPMEFDSDEIIGRFVRGDKSRTEDGNGLGLAIAKSYTEACGGSFDVVIDGDLFKAVIEFEGINE